MEAEVVAGGRRRVKGEDAGAVGGCETRRTCHMNLNTITEVRRVTGNEDEYFDWREGDSWLAGGTWLFSEPQPHLRWLLDLQGFDWEPMVVGEQEFQISPTCTIARLEALEAPPEWPAAPPIHRCCNAFLASFEVWNTATVDGNICMSLPAGPMISLTVALEGIYTLRLRELTRRSATTASRPSPTSRIPRSLTRTRATPSARSARKAWANVPSTPSRRR
jgi:hypothetical protein